MPSGSAAVGPDELRGPAWLFCPADRPDRYGKALAAADLVILDLEDAVAPDQKPAARAALLANPLDADRVIVRVNAAGTADHAEDLDVLRRTGYRRVMLPMTSGPEDTAGLAGWDVIALCETPAGVVNAPRIAAAEAVVALMWGAEDLVAAIGGQSSRFAEGRYRDVARHARSSVLLAAAMCGRAAVDAVYLDIPDLDGLAAEADDAVASGFAYKACIHPSQAEVIRTAFRPGPERVAWAERVLAAMTAGGVATVDGQMVDAPLIQQARHILGRRRP